MLVAEDHGGGSVSGQGLSDLALVAEEFGRRVAPGPLIPTNVVAAALSRAGGDGAAQAAGRAGRRGDRGDLVPRARRAGGADGAGPVRASVKGDGFVLDGSTAPVEAGAEADLVLVTARTDEGPAQFVVPSGTPGLTAQRAESIDLVRRFASLRFDQVEVSADAVLGEPGAAEEDVERQLLDAVVLQCFEMAGAVDRVFEFTVEYAEDRYSFGRPLVSYQALKHRFADMKMWLESCHATAAGCGPGRRLGVAPGGGAGQRGQVLHR